MKKLFIYSTFTFFFLVFHVHGEKLDYKSFVKKFYGTEEKLNRILLEEGVEEEDLEKCKKNFIKYGLRWINNESINSFYGKILDQNGNPVTNAQTKWQRYFFDPKSICQNFLGADTFTVNSDENGLLVIKDIKGVGLSISNIIKKNYEFKSSNNRKTYFCYVSPKVGNGAQDIFVPDKKRPVVFRVRKKGAQAFIMVKDVRIFPHSCKTYQIDILKGKKWVLKNKNIKMKNKCHADFNVTYSENAQDKQYSISFSVPDEDSGIVEKKRFLYKAPENEYVKEITFTVPAYSKKGLKKYFYLKGRAGKLYSRIEVRIYFLANKIPGISFDFWTNPFSSRNLEINEHLSVEERQEFLEKAGKNYGYGIYGLD